MNNGYNISVSKSEVVFRCGLTEVATIPASRPDFSIIRQRLLAELNVGESVMLSRYRVSDTTARRLRAVFH